MGKSELDFEAGRKNIEQRLVSESREAGMPLTADNIIWNRKQDGGGVPEMTTLEVKFQDRTVTAILSARQIEDSWERIARPDVLALIQGCVKKIARPRR